MSLYPELDKLTLPEIIARFQDSPPDEDDYAASYYTEVALLIVQQGKVGIDFLLEEIDRADVARLQAILFALALHPSDNSTIRGLLYKYLADKRPFIVMEAIDGLRHQGEKDAVDKVLALREHPSPYVKGGVLRFMSQLYPQQALPLLIEALNDPHFIIRENAADELGDLGFAEVIPNLHPLLTDESPDVRQAAQTAIKMLESAPIESKTE